MKRATAGLAIAACAVWAEPARAADEDLQSWGQILVTGKLNGRLSAAIEVNPRVSLEDARLEQLLLRPSLTWQVHRNHSISAGYAFVRTQFEGARATREHRPWQQIAIRVAGRPSGATLDARTRLEQRIFEGRSDLGWRLRQQFRLSAPIDGRLRAVAWTEPFVSLNDTGWGQRTGLDRWRNFLGVNIRVRDGVALEPGYLNQYVVRRGEDRINHAVSATLSLTL